MMIEHIRTFLEVAANGSFQVAAERLNVTQSTVSARIKALEDRLKRELFRRKRNGIELTTGGHQFHESALDIVGAWERGQQLVGLPEGTSAVVSIGVEEDYWHRVVPDWLNRMATELPDVVTSAYCDHSDRLMSKLRAGKIDLALLHDPQHCPEVSIEHLMTERLIMVSDRPRQVEAGVVHGYILVDWGERFRLEHGNKFPGVFSHKLTIRNTSLALEHMLRCGGSGYLLENSVAQHIADGRLHLVSGAPSFSRPVYLCVRDETVSNTHLKTTRAAVLQSFATV